MYAIIVTGGKQYRVSKGDVLFIETIEGEADDLITFDNVLAIGGENELTVGTPTIASAKVSAKILKHGKGKKITVFTYKPKNNSKRKKGHRQHYTQVEIQSITG